MYFEDLTSYEYSGELLAVDTVNVGWLSRDRAFQEGSVPAAFVSKLEQLIRQPVNLYRGSHLCEFCPEPPVRITPGGLKVLESPPGTNGNGEIRVRGKNGVTYVAPVLIHHYVTRHGYLPPAEFIDAVEQAAMPNDAQERKCEDVGS